MELNLVGEEKSSRHLEQLLLDLETTGWAKIDNFIDQKLLFSLLELFKNELSNDSFESAAVGADWRNRLDRDIRHSQVSWIEDWHSASELQQLKNLFDGYLEVLNSHFYMSLKRYESQLAFYPQGGYYKKHLDQIKGRNNRQVTMVLYLNECEEGGELVIYDRDDKMKVASTIKPLAARCVIFFSSQIYHEVLPTFSPRFSLTTWFRDDLDGIRIEF